ncbi:hypothetical protein CQW23_24602 [Capsicum baccatum]|uniref:Uncharacterized protein n=1 Tax=Capsicum baccatum TaxID=33114 RepID=A0A2G2VVB5_CAPBA|nr:hypothetical protein CQW23_24602 [Capsicum baccatum]
MSLQIKDQGMFELDKLQRDSNEIANELCRLKEDLKFQIGAESESCSFSSMKLGEDTSQINSDKEMSVDLSLEDVKCVALHYGFVFEKESTIETTYTTNSRSMLQERPVDGSSITTVCSPLRGQNDPLLCQSIRGLHYVVDNMLIELLVYQLMKIGVPTSDEIVVIDSQKTLQQNSKGVTIAFIVIVRNRCNSIYCDALSMATVYTTVVKTIAIELSQRPPMRRLLNHCDRPIAMVLWPIAMVLQPSP